MKKYLVCVIIILSACRKEDMTPIDAKGEILFISRRIPNSADWQMFVMNIDGTNQRLVSSEVVPCLPPVLSNDGKKIAFYLHQNNTVNLFTIDIDGQNQKLLASGNISGAPAWSPDDNRLAYRKATNLFGPGDIYTIRVDGTDELRLTNQYDNYSPQFTPDNNSIIYSSDIDSHSAIYKMNIDGSNKRALTANDKHFGDPKISPDGSKIAITDFDRSGSQIFVMNADGSNLKKLTFTVSPRYFDTGYPRDANSHPAWSPNSSRLTYVSWENGTPDIFVINANGKGNKRLTDSPIRDENPAWTKDGNYIIFSSNRNNNMSAEIYIMRTEGQLQTPLTHYIADDIYPTYIFK